MEWKQSSESTITGYQILLLSIMEDDEQEFNLSNEVHSKQFHVKINADYEVHIRAKNYAGFSLWAKQQLTTAAGVSKFIVIESTNYSTLLHIYCLHSLDSLSFMKFDATIKFGTH